MYATCLFCHAHLGANAVIELFPVGRRLAFDPLKGRLWVVCARCGRWNLTPMEERWEAIEECERRYRQTLIRVSTDNVGLAKLREGLELVRIGAPLRPEFAAWRYGAELRRRRARDLALGAVTAITGPIALGVGAVGAVITLGPLGAAAGAGAFLLGTAALTQRQLARVVSHVPVNVASLHGGAPAAVRERDLRSTRLLPDPRGVRVRVGSDAGVVELEGTAAAHVAALACARRNQIGAGAGAIRAAVRWVEESGGPDGVLRRASDGRRLRRVAYVERLALEMALHEERERRAMEGELAELEAAWREAEEIAAIADDLFLPTGVREFIRRHGGGTRVD